MKIQIHGETWDVEDEDQAARFWKLMLQDGSVMAVPDPIQGRLEEAGLSFDDRDVSCLRTAAEALFELAESVTHQAEVCSRNKVAG